MSCYVCDGELVCEKCAVDVTDDERAIGGESDSPTHCSYCQEPQFDTFGLTDAGVRHVLETVERDLRKGTRDDGWRWDHGWYRGLGRAACVRDWCEYVLDNHHRLGKRDDRVLRWFLFVTQAQYDAQVERAETKVAS
jgi:hypothetical protein